MKKNDKKITIKDIVNKFLNKEELMNEAGEPSIAPTKPKVEPGTTPKTPTRPLKIPTKWPDPAPMPRPKAEINQPVNTPEIAPSKPTTEPTTKPNTPTRPLRIPIKWPEESPMPRPKAQAPVEKLAETKNWIPEYLKPIRAKEELNRMKTLSALNEAPMKFDANEELPDEYFQRGIEGDEAIPHPFSDIELFKTQILDQTALEKIASEEFNEIIRRVGENGKKLSTTEIMNLMKMAAMIESRHIPALERMALNIVQEKFGLTDEVMEKIIAKLTPNENMDSEDFEEPYEEVMDEFSEEEKEIIKKHVDKRKIENALMMGAGYKSHNLYSDLKSRLDTVDPKLFEIYKKMMPSIELWLWQYVVPTFGRMILGKSELKIDKETKEVKAHAQAKLFIVLLHETVKAAMEILTAQHILDIYEKYGEKVQRAVLTAADSYEDEQWMKLIGPQLWKMLHSAISYVVMERGNDYTIVSYVINRMATMEPDEFIEFMKMVITDGGAAVTKINQLIDTIETDIENYEAHTNQKPSPADIDSNKEDNFNDIVNNVSQHSDELTDLLNQKNASSGNGDNKIKDYETMGLDQLNTELNYALEDEAYELAAKIRNIINAKFKS